MKNVEPGGTERVPTALRAKCDEIVALTDQFNSAGRIRPGNTRNRAGAWRPRSAASARRAPREIQEQAFRQGLIPYLP